MPLTKASLAARIEVTISALFDIENAEILAQFADAIAEAVVEEIHSNAVVNSAGTVTSGAGSGGAVVTTGTVL